MAVYKFQLSPVIILVGAGVVGYVFLSYTGGWIMYLTLYLSFSVGLLGFGGGT